MLHPIEKTVEVVEWNDNRVGLRTLCDSAGRGFVEWGTDRDVEWIIRSVPATFEFCNAVSPRERSG